MKVLVVGASGYLGYWVSKLFAESGADVVGLSRRGTAHFGIGIVGDVLSPDLGLDRASRSLLGDVDVVVSCFGSVNMNGDPGTVINTAVNGTKHILDFAASVDSVRRVVYVSSILALGRATGRISNRDLARGQTFRNWYEYAKYRGELQARRESRVEVSILRLGTLLGAAPVNLIPSAGGPISVLPHLLRGFPLFLDECGRYPVFATDVAVAARVVMALADADEPGAACTYFDPARPSLAGVLEDLCKPWGVLPKIVGSRNSLWLQRAAARRFAVDPSTVEYARPLFQFDKDILGALPNFTAQGSPDYVVETARALRDSNSSLTLVGGVR